MPDNLIATDDIIISIKLRLGELDLEIHDAKSLSSLPNIRDYWEGVLDSLIEEKEALEKIMRGEYGRE